MNYELTTETKIFYDKTLYRIRAIKDFNGIKKGELGGWIEKTSNLSGNAIVSGDAMVYGDARVSDNARVSGDARVYGDARVSGDAMVADNAIISGDAMVYGNARVSGDARVSDNARVYGDAKVYGNAMVYGDTKCITGNINKNPKSKLSKLRYELAKQLGITTSDDKIYLFKHVNKISKGRYQSCYDSSFIYQDGKIAKVKKYDKSDKSCAEGIHLATALYWNEGDTLIECEVKLKDIITVQEGKVRCKSCKVIGDVDFK